MRPAWPAAGGEPPASALIRCQPEDFFVEELAGFEPSGDGEHAYLYIEKRELNSVDVVSRLAELAQVPQRDIGFAGMKDRRAVTRQWFSVGLAGRAEPGWQQLEASGEIAVLAVARHRRKLRRGSHAGNRFRIVLRDVQGDRAELQQRLESLRTTGAPNYFGEQRFGRDGSTLAAAQRWSQRGGRVSRRQRGLYLSALRAFLFNELLAPRVIDANWTALEAPGICMLAGSNSYFSCEAVDEKLCARLASGDVHPGLPLWGRASRDDSAPLVQRYKQSLGENDWIGEFLVGQGLDMAWRATRLLPDDFCWQFCDDGRLQIDFALGAGSYATALLAECVRCKDGSRMSGNGSEQG